MVDLTRLAAYLITETASQDAHVGPSVKMITITAQDGYEALSEESISAIVEANEQQVSQLRKYFGHQQ